MKKNYQFHFILIFILFAMWLQPAVAQMPPWNWAVGIPGTGMYESITALATGHRSVVVTGTFQSPFMVLGNDTLFNPDTNYTDAFWARYDMDGNLLWANSGRGALTDGGSVIAVDSFGNTLCGGGFTSDQLVIASDTLYNSNPVARSWDIYLAKFDSLGTLLWARSIGGSASEALRAIVADDAGNIYLAGDFDDDTLFIDGHQVINSNSGTSDGFIARLDPQGTCIWVKGIGGPNSDYPFSMCKMQNNSIVVAGGFYGDTLRLDTAILYNHQNDGTPDLFVARYDTSGSLMWADGDGGRGDDRTYSVVCDAAGYITVCGSFASDTLVFGNTLLKSSGSSDLMVLHYDPLGNRDTAWRAGGTGYDQANVAAVDAKTGSYFLTGNFDSDSLLLDSIAIINPGGIYHMFLAKFDVQDHVQWIEGFSNTDENEAWAAGVDDYGNLYLGGAFSSSSIAFGTNILNNETPGGYDGFLAKLDTLTTLRVHNLQVNRYSFSVYPNPTRGSLEIESLHPGRNLKRIQVFDLQGKLLYEQNSNPSIRKNSWHIDLKGASPGMYFLKLTTSEGNETRKIMISE